MYRGKRCWLVDGLCNGGQVNNRTPVKIPLGQDHRCKSKPGGCVLSQLLKSLLNQHPFDKMAATFTDDILKRIFLNENVWISINISLKFVPKGPIDNNICSCNGLAPSRRHAIIWTNAYPIYRRTYAALWGDEVTNMEFTMRPSS